MVKRETAVKIAFHIHFVPGLNDGARSVSTSDLDADGDLDILSVHTDANTIAWYEHDGAPMPQFTEHVVATDLRRPNYIRGVDMDGDQDVDILCSSSVDDGIRWYEHDGAAMPSFTEHIVSLDPNGPDDPPAGLADGVRQVFAADLDGDEDLDIGSVSVEDDEVAWYENDGGTPPQFTQHVLTQTLDGARAIDAADLDADGDIDIIAGAWYDENIVWFENVGGSPTSFVERVLVTFDNENDPVWGIGQVWRVFAADLDGDEDLDVLSARALLGFDWYESDGGSPPTFTRRVLIGNANFGKSCNAADIDGDGDIDPLIAAAGDDLVAWFENLGGSPPTFEMRVITEDPDGTQCCGGGGPLEGPANGARSVHPADLDGDGDVDVLWASKHSNRVAWEENRLIHEPIQVCTGDLSENGGVDTPDFFMLIAAWGVNPGDPADLDGSGVVDTIDLFMLIALWGPC